MANTTFAAQSMPPAERGAQIAANSMPVIPAGLSKLHMNAGTVPSNWAPNASVVITTRHSNQGGQV